MTRRPRLPGLAIAVVVTVLAGGCTAQRQPTAGPLELPASQRDLVGRWHDADGREVPDGTDASGGILVLQAGTGSTSCTDEQVTVFVELAWPPGRRLDWSRSYRSGDTHTFVRATAGSLLRTDGESDLAASLPGAAKPTGLNKDGNRLYTIEADPTSIWVRRADGHVERWARLHEAEGCA